MKPDLAVRHALDPARVSMLVWRFRDGMEVVHWDAVGADGGAVTRFIEPLSGLGATDSRVRLSAVCALGKDRNAPTPVFALTVHVNG